ncbi:hypothetical protein KUTeg_009695 [Tegillarca granosa]|uniref:Uncharacterized protein n=1 Tax=Tegillarca granosa TaxID=220873 RepID=A0ABQ9F4N8_TEGGR|nr:hypothetical protein KUTeg_009695 [Tegillarca granosa]
MNILGYDNDDLGCTMWTKQSRCSERFKLRRKSVYVTTCDTYSFNYHYRDTIVLKHKIRMMDRSCEQDLTEGVAGIKT